MRLFGFNEIRCKKVLFDSTRSSENKFGTSDTTLNFQQELIEYAKQLDVAD